MAQSAAFDTNRQPKQYDLEVADGHPDLLNRALPLNVGEVKDRTGRNVYRGRKFPTLTKVTCGGGVRPFGCHSALARLAGQIFRADGACLSIGEAGKISEMCSESVKGR